MRIRRLCWPAVSLAAAMLFAAEPDDTLALGRKALRNDGVATAGKLAEKAISETPDSAAAHEFAGEVLFRRGEFAQAEAEFRTGTKLDPNYALAWWGLARVSECASLTKSAAGYFQHAFTLDPKDPRIFRDWATRLTISQQAEALEKYLALAARGNSEPALEDLNQRLQYAKVIRERQLMVLVSPYKATGISLDASTSAKTHMRSFSLQVRLNDVVMNLVVDTGATSIVIPRRLAERAGVVRLAQATLRGFGNNVRLSGGYRGVAQHLRIGDIEYRDAPVLVSDQDSIGNLDGVMGTDVFRDFLITLNFRARQVRLNPIPGYHPGDNSIQDRTVPAGLENAAQVYRLGALLLLPTRVNGAHQALFVIDTGSDRTLISYDLAAEVSKLSRETKLRMTGVNGQVADLYQTGNLVLQFAGFEQRNLGMSSIDTWEQSRRLGTEISGFLGLPVLDLFTLTIDYRDGLVKFERPGS